MFPSGELKRLAARKAILRQRIAVSRLECRVAVGEISRPLAQVDRVLTLWRQIQPLVRLVALPAGSWLLRSSGKRFWKLRTLVRWGPMVFRLLRVVWPTGRRRAAAEVG